MLHLLSSHSLPLPPPSIIYLPSPLSTSISTNLSLTFSSLLFPSFLRCAELDSAQTYVCGSLCCRRVQQYVFDYLKSRSKNRRPLARLLFYASESLLDPSFYAAQPNPIDLLTVQRRLRAGAYASLKELAQELCVLLNNVLRYNQAKPVVCDDVVALHRSLLQAARSSLCSDGQTSPAQVSVNANRAKLEAAAGDNRYRTLDLEDMAGWQQLHRAKPNAHPQAVGNGAFLQAKTQRAEQLQVCV